MEQKAYSQEVIMAKIGAILEGRGPRISTYEIMGYGHLETLLRIYYRDCDEVILLKWIRGGMELEVDYAYTPNHPEDHAIKHTQEWVKRYQILETKTKKE